jgi:hypothetical protein
MGGLPRGEDWLLEADLSVVLRHLMRRESSTRKTKEARKRLANHPLTREYLDAGLRLLSEQFGAMPDEPDDELWHSASPFFSWLSEQKVIDEVSRIGRQKGSQGTFSDRWPYRDFYIEDLLHYSLWLAHWAENANMAREASRELSVQRSLAGTIHEMAYRISCAKLVNKSARLLMITTAIADRYPELKHKIGEIYRIVDELWIPVYERLYEVNGLTLRPGITHQDVTDILSAVSGGLAIHAVCDSQQRFVDHDARRSLLGKAAIGLLMAFADTGDGKTLDEAIDTVAGRPGREDRVPIGRFAVPAQPGGRDPALSGRSIPAIRRHATGMRPKKLPESP